MNRSKKASNNHCAEPTGKIKVWTDGCFDMMHYGHFRALRQAHELGGYVVVGLQTDEEIRTHKGFLPIMTLLERRHVLDACRWVNEIVDGSPYATSYEMVKQYGCSLAVHGDDIAFDSMNNDSMKEVKERGAYQNVRRTKGISTTHLVDTILSGRMSQPPMPFEFMRDFQTRGIEDDDEVVYVSGTFDLMHAGHIDILQHACQMNKKVLVGLVSDSVAEQETGSAPFQSVIERALAVASCRFVDEVVINAPYCFDFDTPFIENVVAVLTARDSDRRRHEAAEKAGILHRISGDFSYLSAEKIIKRVQDRREELFQKISKGFC